MSLTVPNDIVANLTGGAKARDAKRAIQPLRGQGLHHAQKKQQSNDGQSGVIASPMQAVVTRINVAEGQQVAKGDLLVVLESMKMENYVYAPVKGAVTKIFVGPRGGRGSRRNVDDHRRDRSERYESRRKRRNWRCC